MDEDYTLSEMAIRMKSKYNEYCGDMEKVNQFLFVAIVLDPRYKLDYVEYCFGVMYSDHLHVCSSIRGVKNLIMEMNDWYVKWENKKESSQSWSDVDSSTSELMSGSSQPRRGSSQSSKSISSSTPSSLVANFRMKQKKKLLPEIKNDVERYLLDPCEQDNDPDFDILSWWRVHGIKYITLSKIAKDVLAIQVSIVASESAFSTGGRILTPFRSSLLPKIVEVLICTQNWLRFTPSEEKSYLEDVEYYDNLDGELSKSSTSKEDLSSKEK